MYDKYYKIKQKPKITLGNDKFEQVKTFVYLGQQITEEETSNIEIVNKIKLPISVLCYISKLTS